MITKTTMVVIFNLRNSHLLTLSLPTVVDFHSQPRKMPTPKPLNTQLSVTVFTVCQQYEFFSVLAAIIRESSNKLPCAESREGFAVPLST